MSKELSFTLLLEAETGQFVKATKQSEQSVKAMFEQIRQQSQKLDENLDKLAQQQALIDSFRQLKKATDEAKEKMESSQQATNALAREWKNAERQAQTLAQSIKDKGNATKAEKDALKQAEKSAKDLQRQFQASIKETKQLQSQHESLNLKLHDVRKSMVETGLSTTNLAEQQTILSKKVEESQQRLQRLSNEANDVNAKLAYLNDLSNAKSTLGLDIDNRIYQEIEQVNQAFEKLKNSGTLTQKQLAQATDLHRQRIQALHQQLGQTGDSLANLFNVRSNNAISTEISQVERGLQRLQQQYKRNEITQQEFNRLNQAGQQRLQNLRNELAGTAQQANQANQGFSRLGQGVTMLKTGVLALAGAMATLGLGLGLQELANTADSYVNLTARVKIATQETGNFAKSMAGIHQIALMSNTNLEDTAKLFARLNTVGHEMGMTTQQALELTKTVNLAIQLGGGSVQASEAAVQQFVQALQGGVLRGDEFNSIMENGYPLADALAKGLGRTTSELRKMAENGELTADRVVKAISSQAKQVEANYAKMPTTIGNALQRIATQWQILIGELDQANNGASGKIAQWLVKFADSLGGLKGIIEDIGSGFVWIGNRLTNIDPSTIKTLKLTLSTAYDTVKDLLKTLGSLDSTIIGLGSSLYDAFTKPFFTSIISGQKDVSGFETALNNLRLVLGLVNDAVTGATIGIQVLTGVLQLATAGLLDFGAKVNSFLGFDTLATQAQQASDRIFAEAQKNFKRANELAMNHKNGIVQVYQDINKSQAQRDKERLVQYEQTLKQIEAKEKQHNDSYKAISDERIRLEQQLHNAKLAKNQEAIDKATAGLDKLQKKEQTFQEQQKTFANDRLQLMQQWTDAQIRLATENGSALTTIEKNTIKAKVQAQGLAVEFDNAGKAIVRTVDAVAQVSNNAKKITDDARKSASALEIDLDQLLNRVSEGFQANVSHLDKLALGLENLGAKGDEVGHVLYTAWEKWLSSAKSKAELELAKQKLQEFEKQGVFSTKQVELGIEAIRRANSQLPAELTETEKAFERLGIKTKEQLRLSAELALSDFKKVQQSGQATADQLKQAYERVLQSAQASGDQAVLANAKAQASIAGLKVEADDTGKLIVNSMNDVAQSIEQVAYSASTTAVQGFKQMAESAKESLDETRGTLQQWQQQAEQLQRSRQGASFTAYSKQGVEERLKAMGYDGEQLKKLVEEIWAKGRAKDADIMQRNMSRGGYANNGFRQLAKQGLVSSFGTAEIEKALANLTETPQKVEQALKDVMPTLEPVTNIKPHETVEVKKVVELRLTAFDKKSELTGTEQNVDSLEQMLRQLETIKKRM